nr:MAG TPA: ROS/MUCR transcriptional regulator protein [Caudoviricetes sp.]
MRVGDIDGYGRYGLVDENEAGLLCHECGKRYRHLSTHVSLGHKIRVADYRRRHGLHAKRPLVASEVRDNMRESWGTHREQHLEDLDRHRDPHKAIAASIDAIRNKTEGAKAGQRAHLQRRRGRALTPDEVTALESTATISEWCQVAYRILDDPAVSVNSLARSIGMERGTAHHRLANRRPKGWESKGSGNRVQPEAP